MFISTAIVPVLFDLFSQPISSGCLAVRGHFNAPSINCNLRILRQGAEYLLNGISKVLAKANGRRVWFS